MNCATVRDMSVEYVEHGLCVADELCVDIHLVQCDSCRTDLEEVQDFGKWLAAELRHPAPQSNWSGLTRSLRDVREHELSRETRPAAAIPPAVFRLFGAAGIAILLLAGGLFARGGEKADHLGLSVVEAETVLNVPEAWRPWMFRNQSLVKEDGLDEILSQSQNGPTARSKG